MGNSASAEPTSSLHFPSIDEFDTSPLDIERYWEQEVQDQSNHTTTEQLKPSFNEQYTEKYGTNICDIVQCIECVDQVAQVHCQVCQDDYCIVCFSSLHRKGNRSRHGIRKLMNYPSSLSSDLHGLISSNPVLDVSSDGNILKPTTNNNNNDYNSNNNSNSNSNNQTNRTKPTHTNHTLHTSNSSKTRKQAIETLASNLSTSPSPSPSPPCKKTETPCTSTHWRRDPSLESKLYFFPDFRAQQQHIPIRINESERELLRILEEALNISEYTDKVDTSNQSRSIMNHEIQSFLHTLLALALTQNIRTVKRSIMASPNLVDHAAFFQSVFEIGRRHKVRNPDKMRTTYGKMMYLLMDSRLHSSIGFSLISPLKTVPLYLESLITTTSTTTGTDMGTSLSSSSSSSSSSCTQTTSLTIETIAAFLDDPVLRIAVAQVDTLRATNPETISLVRSYRDEALTYLLSLYTPRGLKADDIRLCVSSFLDCSSYLSYSTIPIHFLYSNVLKYFDPAVLYRLKMQDSNQKSQEETEEDDQEEKENQNDDDDDDNDDNDDDTDDDENSQQNKKKTKQNKTNRHHPDSFFQNAFLEKDKVHSPSDLHWLSMQYRRALHLTKNNLEKDEEDEKEEQKKKENKSKNVIQKNVVDSRYLSPVVTQKLSSSQCLSSIDIRVGVNGARLTHSHDKQLVYITQTLQLWITIVNRMFQLWYCADTDMLSGENYRLVDTGQGLNRVQQPHRVGQAISACLNHTQEATEFAWVGSSVIHLGDRYVPSALVFIDKYCRIQRILTPIARAIRLLLTSHQTMMEPRFLTSFTSSSLVNSSVSNPIASPLTLNQWIHAFNAFSLEKDIKMNENQVVAALVNGKKPPKNLYFTMKSIPLQHSVVCYLMKDLFKHAFDGSGGADYMSAGDCIDGRLTSLFDWTTKIEKKSYYYPFLTTGFLGFDGVFSD